jgi:sodium/potassium-transporting ATPase subunit alpha
MLRQDWHSNQGKSHVLIHASIPNILQNQMTVSDCLVGRDAMTASVASGVLGITDDEGTSSRLFKPLKLLSEIGGLCNAGEFDPTTIHLPPDLRKVHGDATDQAVLRFSEGLTSVAQMRENWKRIFRVAFNSKNKFMIQLIEPATAPIEDDKISNVLLTIKGAPDILLPRCTGYIDKMGETKFLTKEQRTYLENIKDKWSAQGKRVILLAIKPVTKNTMALSINSQHFEDAVMEEASSALEFVGLVAIVDPPRDEIPEVVQILRGAGIKVHMVTGDFRLTAQAIAVECGIITVPLASIDDASALSLAETSDLKEPHSTRAITLSGEDMKTLDDSQWDTLCKYDEIVFARTTPEQKLRIVKELQKRDEIVGSKFASFDIYGNF